MENNNIFVNYSPPPTKSSTSDLVLSELRCGGRNITTSVQQEQPPCLEHLMDNFEAIKWTDEKHSLYLKSMETSFVNQLHESIDRGGWSSQKHVSKHNSSGQFNVLREGWRGKTNFRNEEAELNKLDETEVVQIISNPYTRRYRSDCRRHTKSLDNGGSCGLNARNRVIDRGSSDQYLEVTDQNFIDIDTEGKKECELLNSKRVKTKSLSNN